MIYQVAIIGGGLAGLALSIDLKRRGYSVIIIEKGNYPRHKVCGEYISRESQKYLYTLCPTLKNLDLPIITNFKITSGNNSEFTTPLDLGGFGISRYLLEELLFKEATQLGVTFLLNTKAIEVKNNKENYSIKTSSGDVETSIVCNSSGRKSNLETKNSLSSINGNNYVGVKYHIKLKIDPKLIEIHNFPGGYCGVSTIENDIVCLCYIVNADKLKEANNSINNLQEKVLFKNAQLKKIITEAEFLYKEPLTISGINFRIKEAQNNTTFFLGDAAGSIAPITGNGMSIGLRSAATLSKLLDDYFTKKITKSQLQSSYQLFWQTNFSSRIKLSRYFQKLSEFPLLTKITIALFRLFPFIARLIIKLTHGKPF